MSKLNFEKNNSFKTRRKVPDQASDLYMYITCGNFDEFRKTVDSGADLNSHVKGVTPVILSIYRKQYKFLQYLIDHGADLNVRAKGDRKEPPLYAACRRDDMKVAKMLLDSKRIDVDQREFYDKTPLWCTTRYSTVQMAELLLDNFADIRPEEGLFSGALYIIQVPVVLHFWYSHSERCTKIAHLLIRRGCLMPLDIVKSFIVWSLCGARRDYEAIYLLYLSGYNFGNTLTCDLDVQHPLLKNDPKFCEWFQSSSDHGAAQPYDLLILANRVVREALCIRWKNVHPQVVEKLPISKILKEVVLLK